MTTTDFTQNHEELGKDFADEGLTFARQNFTEAETAVVEKFLDELPAEALGRFVQAAGAYLLTEDARDALAKSMESKKAAALLTELLGYVTRDTSPCRTGFAAPFGWPSDSYRIRQGTVVRQRRSTRSDERLHLGFNGQHIGVLKITSANGYISAPVCVFGSGEAAQRAAEHFVASDAPLSVHALENSFFPPA